MPDAARDEAASAMSTTSGTKHESGFAETLKVIVHALIIAMVILVADVSCFVWGVTHRYRETMQQMTKEEMDRLNELNKIKQSAPNVRSVQ